MTGLSVGHAITDMSQGAVPALLPFLIDARGYSYAAASASCSPPPCRRRWCSRSSALWSDRAAMAWVIPLGVLLSGLGLAGVGVAPAD